RPWQRANSAAGAAGNDATQGRSGPESAVARFPCQQLMAARGKIFRCFDCAGHFQHRLRLSTGDRKAHQLVPVMIVLAKINKLAVGKKWSRLEMPVMGELCEAGHGGYPWAGQVSPDPSPGKQGQAHRSESQCLDWAPNGTRGPNRSDGTGCCRC